MAMPTYAERLKILCERKLEYTKDKQQTIGYMDTDDSALILPPPEHRKIVKAISGSGMPVTDVLINTFTPTPNHPSGNFYGPVGQGMNFRDFLLAHPPFVDPMSGLAGAYMCNFGSYRHGKNPDLDYSELHPLQEKYQLVHGVFSAQHFCQDLQIGLDLGYDGLHEKIAHYRALNGPEHYDFYEGLDMVLDGIQGWIEHNADEAERMSKEEKDPEIAEHLRHLCALNRKIAHQKPETYEEACQFIIWYQMACRSYNGSGSLGRLDGLLNPYYLRDKAAGILDDEKAVFLVACLLLRDTAYLHLGGYDAQGNDATCEMSYHVLDAVHRLKLPSNAGVCVGKGIDRGLLRKSVEYQFADKNGNPRFVGMDSLVRDMMRNPGMTIEDARMRTNAGCHWMAIPGREYSIMDCVKINFSVLLDIALREAVEEFEEPTIDQILDRYSYHMHLAVETLAKGFDFHYDNQIHNVPEMPLDLMCYGTIEKGLDASGGGVEHYLWCIDGAALAVAADSLASISRRILREHRFTYRQLLDYLDSDWAGEEGEKARLFMNSVDRYGKGGSEADELAVRLSRIFADEVKAQRTPKHGFQMIPGLFSWANTLTMGATLGATPNGRKAGQPISHGANPNPGFRKDGAATAMSAAIASVQPGYGNTAPMQIELEPSVTTEEEGVELVMALIEDHFANGGTLINLNVIDAERVRKAHEDPSLYPDLVVRVTGFSAYFASLSPKFRQLVVDRILDKQVS